MEFIVLIRGKRQLKDSCLHLKGNRVFYQKRRKEFQIIKEIARMPKIRSDPSILCTIFMFAFKNHQRKEYIMLFWETLTIVYKSSWYDFMADNFTWKYENWTKWFVKFITKLFQYHIKDGFDGLLYM